MSNDVINLVYGKVIGSPARKSILVYLADRANDDGSDIYPAKATIAAVTECARSTVFREIGNFVDEGILIETGRRRTTKGWVIVYSMDLERVASLPDSMLKSETDGPTAGPSRSGTVPQQGPDRPAAGLGPSRSGTQTILEPSLNHSLSERESANDEIQSAFTAWNELAERAGLSKAQKMTKPRKQKMAARLRDVGGLAGWHDALALVEASPFLTGQAPGANGTPFRASLDFVLSEEKFTKIMEKQYAERPHRNSADGRGGMAHVEQTGRRGQRASFAGQIARDRLQNGK